MKSRFLLFALGLCALAGPRVLALDIQGDDSDFDHRDHVEVMNSNTVAADETVHGDCVTVMGDATIDGHVTHDCVTVLGNAVINGRVEHDVVAIGSLRLGPKAYVGHDVVCIGALTRAPGAFIGHNLVNPWRGPAFLPSLHHAHVWWDSGLHRGQFLVLGPSLWWLWSLSLISLGMSVIVTLIAPVQVHRAGDLLVSRPGHVILSAIVAMIGVPLALFLLLVSVIGIPLLFLAVPAAFVLPMWFGRAALYSLFGRRLMGERTHAALTVLVGGLIVLAIYLLPFFGFLCFMLVSFLAWGCAWAALFGGTRAPRPVAVVTPPPPPAPPPPPPAYTPPPPVYAPPPPVAPEAGAGYTAAAAAAAAASIPGPAPAAVPPVPPLPSAVPRPLFPRASFWRRIWALLIDVIVVGVASAICVSLFDGHGHGGGGWFLVLVAAYGAVLWKLRGTTIGGIICHLSVERMDGRPIDWPTAIVRALGCFVSLFVVGLGFLWIVFDPERQSWHDKIAGTIVVVTPRGQPLV